MLGSSVQVPKADVKRFSVKKLCLKCSKNLQENVYVGVLFYYICSPRSRVFSNGFSGKFQKSFSTEQLRTAILYFGTKKERCKYWSSIVLLESGITSEKAKFRFFRKKKGLSFAFKFWLEVSLRYQFRGFMFKELLWSRKNNKMFSNNKTKLNKVLQQNMAEGIQQFPMLSSKYENNSFFWLR